MKFYLVFAFLVCISNTSIAQSFSYRTEAEEEWINNSISSMSLEEKVAQLVFPAAWSNKDSTHTNEIRGYIRKYGIGGLIFFQGGPGRQVQLSNEYQELSKIPLLIGIDAEWGLGMRLDSTISYPYQMTLGAVQDEDLILQMGEQIGAQLRRTGIHINLAPVLDINSNPENPVINVRSFGENKESVSRRGSLYAQGMANKGVLAVGKHFPGHGDTKVDSHLDLPVIDRDYNQFMERELVPFEYSIQQGLQGIMSAHLSIPNLEQGKNRPSTLSSNIINGVLKDSLGFDGLVFTDAMNMQGVAKYYDSGFAELEALKAGNDIILYPRDVEVTIRVISDAVRKRELSEVEIDKRVRKILSLKYQFGLIDNAKAPSANIVKDLNHLEYHLLERKLRRESLTLIKNDSDIIPLRGLDTLKVLSLHLGKQDAGIVEERLNNYTVAKSINLKQIEDFDINSLKNEDFNLMILTVSGLSKHAYKDYFLNEERIKVLEEIIATYNPVLNWIGNPYALAKISNFNDSRACIVTYEESRDIMDFSIQAIFGGIALMGKLPVSINDDFGEGTGIQTQHVRFQYALPEEAGLNGDYLHNKIDSIATLALDSGVAPGIQVLVAKDRKLVMHQTWGYHTYDSERAVDKKDLYDLASVTKITGALPALMQFHDQGTFDLDLPTAAYSSAFKKKNKRKLINRRVLSHNAGLRAWIPYWTTTVDKEGDYKSKIYSSDSTEKYSIKLKDSLWLRSDYRKTIYKLINKSEVEASPTYVYSGLSFYVWPQVVEDLSGGEYETYLKQNIYERVGAFTTTFNPLRFYSEQQIIPTEVDTFFRKMPIHGVVHDEGAAMMAGVSSNAGLFSSTEDLAKIMQMYLDGGTYGRDTIISKNTVKEFTFCHYCNLGNRRGLGFDKPVLENKENGSTAIDAGDSSFGHSGYTGTFTWADPDTGILFVFMSNRVYPTRENRKLYQLNIRPAMHQVVYDSRINK